MQCGTEPSFRTIDLTGGLFDGLLAPAPPTDHRVLSTAHVDILHAEDDEIGLADNKDVAELLAGLASGFA